MQSIRAYTLDRCNVEEYCIITQKKSFKKRKSLRTYSSDYKNLREKRTSRKEEDESREELLAKLHCIPATLSLIISSDAPLSAP